MAGFIGYYLLGWRWAFILAGHPHVHPGDASPSGCKEPTRGLHERASWAPTRRPPHRGEARLARRGVAHPVAGADAARFCIGVPFILIPTVALPRCCSCSTSRSWASTPPSAGIGATTEPFQLVGLFIGVPLAARYMRVDPTMVAPCSARRSAPGGAASSCWSRPRTSWLVVPLRGAGDGPVLAPGLIATLSLINPPRVRSVGFSLVNLFILPRCWYSRSSAAWPTTGG